MPRPLQESDLIFSSAASDLKTALGELKRSNLSITNRLHSIKQDAAFVQKVAEAYQLPLVANERCGSWYIPPRLKAGSTYFKSTDGHFGQWSFSLRRLNLQVLDIVAQHRGCIVVDSTRRGKKMPDALSKTVPIWIDVLNRLLFPEKSKAHALRTAPAIVSPSEHSQIDARIPAFVESLRQLDLDIGKLRSMLVKPLQPLWVTPGGTLDTALMSKDVGYHPIILCTASNRMSEGMHHASNYVQGAADDSESWAHGLDPSMFWANSDQLLRTCEEEMTSRIEGLVAEARKETIVRLPTLIGPSRNIWVANNAAAQLLYTDFDLIVYCSATMNATLAETLKDHSIHLACSTGKNGSRQLRTELPKLQTLSRLLQLDSKVLIACQTGKDLAVGVALAMLCSLYSSDGMLRPQSTDVVSEPRSKTLIKHRLSWIMVSMPDAAPSRATLQSVNAYLMG